MKTIVVRDSDQNELQRVIFDPKSNEYYSVGPALFVNSKFMKEHTKRGLWHGKRRRPVFPRDGILFAEAILLMTVRSSRISTEMIDGPETIPADADRIYFT